MPGSVASGNRLRQHRAVAGQYATALDLQLVQQRPHVERIVLELRGVDDGPASGPYEQQGEEHDQEDEDAQNGLVQGSSPVCARDKSVDDRAAASGDRARSEASSTSATNTKLAMIELPP